MNGIVSLQEFPVDPNAVPVPRATPSAADLDQITNALGGGANSMLVLNSAIDRGNDIAVQNQIIADRQSMSPLDFEAKYEGASREVTPAEISSELERQVKEYTSKIYTALNCSGFVRVDYILVGDTFHLIEVNTVPGMTAGSLVPRAAAAAGMTFGEFLDEVVLSSLAARGLAQ